MPQIYASFHIFHENAEKVLNYVTEEFNTEELINDEIERVEEKAFTHFESFEDFQKYLEHDPGSRYIRQFCGTVLSLYDEWVPPEVVRNDFAHIGVHLNIWGDIICQPGCVTMISPKLFSCIEENIKGVVYWMARNSSRRLRRRVVSHSLGLENDGSMECRLYFMNRSDICIVRRNSDESKNYTENVEALDTMFPDVDWPTILAQKDIVEFSDSIGEALGVILDDPKLDQKKQELTFVETYRLYDVYRV